MPEDRAGLAREHLERARQALEAGDETAAVLWSNLCSEVAVAQIADEQEVEVRRDHFRRATLAKKLFQEGVLSDDVADLMIRLNNERKHGAYEGRPPDLRGRSWEEIFASLDRLVETAEQAVAKRPGGAGR